jgi:hypothetical protein
MRNQFTKYGHFFVLLAFLAGIIAPACGFAWGGKYSVVEICTTKGIESRIVENNQQPDKSHYEEQCQFCFSQGNLNPLLPHNQNIETAFFINEKIKFRHYEVIFQSHLTQDNTARAPPVFI